MQALSPSLERYLDTIGNLAAKSPDGAAHITAAAHKDATAKINGELSRYDKGFTVGFQPNSSPDDLIAEAKSALNSSDPLGLRAKPKSERMAIAKAYNDAMAHPLEFSSDDANNSVKSTIANFVGMMGARTKATTTTGMTTGTGLVPYALDVPAFLLYPVVTPLRKRTARRTVGGTAYRYKRVTGIDTLPDEGWVAEATATTTGRASSIAIDTDDKTAIFKTLGLDDFYTQEMFFGEESKVDGANFDSVAVAGIASLQAYLMREERAMLWANGGQTLAVPTGLAANVTQAAAGFGSLAAATAYDFQVSALTGAGLRTYKAKGNVSSTDAKGETSPSTLASVTTAASGAGNKSVTLTWNSVKGAYAYNIYAGAHSGTLYYVATVYQTGDTSGNISANASSLTVTAIPLSGGVPNTTNTTQSANAYDGLTSLIAFNGDSYLADILGLGYTSDGAGGVSQITTAFKSLYDASSTNKGPVGVQRIYTGSSDRYAIDKLILGSTGHPNYTVFLSDGEVEIKGGVMVTSLLNRFMNEQVALETHPYLPSGQCIGVNESMGPYFPNAKIPAGWEMMMGFDAVRIDYGVTARKQEWGIYGSGAPIMRFPAAFFNIVNSGS